ncbi:MAG TPA: M14 family zinc carboxypeptidase [Gemmatimonadaceae bacterium]|nr:M14 family zinc carboxypeptidase [Gemmatimonadaceae bacterium]
MRRVLLSSVLLSILSVSLGAQGATARPMASQATDLSAAKPGREPSQPIDEDYTRKIREYTTESFFLSPLVDYLPASSTVPAPKAVLGDIAGAPTRLPYSKEVYAYMRMLEKASPRVKVYSIGTTEEGREMIAVAVASESLMAKLDENRAKLAQLADPRTIGMDDALAERIAASAAPVYYVTGTIHSPEAGAPTALMELAYRLAVDESPYIRNIRNNLITLITPIVEVDGRDRQVDIYNWHMKHPNETWPNLVYWGKYVAHDNNRDAMGMTLKLTQHVADTYVAWKAQVLHDLHESVPYLYDNTIGDGPFNAWIDPLLTNEWQMVGWHNVQEMTRMGMPGVFAHGRFDTWSPGYLMFIAATHNGISRLYETFGNGGTAETLDRTLSPGETERTWYRQNPPLPRVKWSLRNNNNYEQTGVLISLNYFASNRRQFLQNFYEKSKRSILKARTEGPAAYVLPANDPRPGAQAELLAVMKKQGVEVSRATAPFTVQVPATAKRLAVGGAGAGGRDSVRQAANPTPQTPNPAPQNTDQTFPAGSYVIRMDQPYSRIADALLDYQYWSPNDPQKTPYDDTGWTFPEGFAVQAIRVADTKVLDVPVEKVTTAIKPAGGISGSGNIFLVNHNADNALATLRYRLKAADFQVSEEPFEVAGEKFTRGSFVIRNAAQADLDRAARDLGLKVTAVASAPTVKTHPARAARIAILHNWISTQTEGWWRLAFDGLQIPYEYISTQDVAKTPNLNLKYDVILFPPAGGSVQQIIQGLPMWRNPVPWKNTPETPNIGTWAQTDDMRPGLGWQGLANLEAFVKKGGVLVGVDNTADLTVQTGLVSGVSVNTPPSNRVVGSLLRSRIVDEESPIVYGIKDNLAVYSDAGESFNVGSTRGGFRSNRFGGGNERATGRGTVDDPDVSQGRAALDPRFEAPKQQSVQPWERAPLSDEQLRNPINIIPPAQRPRVALRFADQRELLVSGLLDGGSDIAQRPIVVDVPVEQGHVVLFATNPVWRGETIGSYFLVFNTILNFDNLNAGRKLDAR